MSAPLLQARGLTLLFGGVHALERMDLEVSSGGIHAVIGPNGAGKTTLFNVLSGVLKPHGGTVSLEGREVTGLPPHRIAAAGLTRTFQNLQLFGEMTVLENVMVGTHLHTRSGFFSSALRLPTVVREEREVSGEAMALLEFVGLSSLAGMPAGSLPFGRQRLLEVARALASRPRLLLLDEPAAGLNMRETEDLADLIVQIRGRGVTILLVEHDMDLVMGISDRVTVMNQGTRIADGDPETVRQDPAVLKAYLGEEE